MPTNKAKAGDCSVRLDDIHWKIISHMAMLRRIDENLKDYRVRPMDECLYGKGGPGSRYTRGQRLKDEEAFHYLVKEDFINGVVGGAWHEEGYYISNRGYLADMIYWKLRVLNREWECGNEIR